MERRVRMLAEHDTGTWSVTALCARYGISRDTFHAWRRRRASGEAAWFVDRLHARSGCPHRTMPERVDRIVDARERFEYLAPRKPRAMLGREQPEVIWPVRPVATFGRYVVIGADNVQRMLVAELTVETSVPEPTSALLLGAAQAGFAALRRR